MPIWEFTLLKDDLGFENLDRLFYLQIKIAIQAGNSFISKFYFAKKRPPKVKTTPFQKQVLKLPNKVPVCIIDKCKFALPICRYAPYKQKNTIENKHSMNQLYTTEKL